MTPTAIVIVAADVAIATVRETVSTTSAAAHSTSATSATRAIVIVSHAEAPPNQSPNIVTASPAALAPASSSPPRSLRRSISAPGARHPRRLQRVAQQERDRHRADTAG